MSDAVNHPKHYTSHPSGVECVTITEHFNFNVGNAIKYLWRAGLKGEALEDLKKAEWYVRREIHRQLGGARPQVICLCGSTRFMDEMQRVNAMFTAQGFIVLAPAIVTSGRPSDEEKTKLDELHLRKIDLADQVYVVNKDGYVGESTRHEIAYAESTGKRVRYMVGFTQEE